MATRKKLTDKHKKNISKGIKKNLPKTIFKKGQSPHNKGIEIIKDCEACRKEFIYKFHRKTFKKFCSNNCRNIGSIGRNNSPNTEFKKGCIPWHKGKKNPKITGKNNPNWKGGISPLNKKIRDSYKYKQWRSNIFERDNWTCQTCRKRGCFLEAHHKKKFISIIKENKITSIIEAEHCKELWDIKNGIALCKDCHNLTKG